MDKQKKKPDKREHFVILLRNGFYQGIGWALGVTLGFALVSSLLIYALNIAGGIPLIGDILANIVGETITNLEEKNFIEIIPTPSPKIK